MSQALSRERRAWSIAEDQLLREAVQQEDPHNPNPSKWHAISKHVPNRTNKDCRKRWFAKMASDVVKGGWSPQEDEKLVSGIERYGTRWSLVASVVQTRNSDQCAKRWTDTLNPAIDRTTWTPEADILLLRAVAEHGKVWTKIVKTYFPGRTGLSAKNRYNSITRVNSDASRMPRHRRKSLDSLHKSLGRRSESISSSSSVSPASTHISLPSSFHHAIDLKPHYEMDQYSTWPTDALPPFRTTPMAFEYSTHPPSLSNPLIETGYKSRDLPMKHQSLFQDQSYMYTRPPVSVSNQQPFRHFADSPTTHSGGISNSKFQNLSQFTQDFNDVESQFSFFCGQAADVDTASVMGMAWSENMPTTPLPEPKPTTFCDFRHPLSHEAYSIQYVS